MALSSFGRGREGMEGSPGVSSPPASASPGGLSAFIDQGSEFEGKLSFKDTVRIDGRFRGEISSDNTLIEEGAVLNGQVKMKAAEVKKVAGSSGNLKAIEGGHEAKQPAKANPGQPPRNDGQKQS